MRHECYIIRMLKRHNAPLRAIKTKQTEVFCSEVVALISFEHKIDRSQKKDTIFQSYFGVEYVFLSIKYINIKIHICLVAKILNTHVQLLANWINYFEKPDNRTDHYILRRIIVVQGTYVNDWIRE